MPHPEKKMRKLYPEHVQSGVLNAQRNVHCHSCVFDAFEEFSVVFPLKSTYICLCVCVKVSTI